uniref:Fork-head domain-containing protein n=1 Tax=Ganoderma boninense TaxID=34458 RepID=A0A5K1JS54_9APHY|nr:Fork-head domain-containing protein [Ganoderma boninense]
MSRLHASLIASAIAAEGSQSADDIERPSTPDHAVTPPPSSTPLRVDDLESELIDFSPFKSLSADVAHLFGASSSSGLLPPSPSLSVFTARAPLLQGSMEDLAGDWMSAISRSPIAPIPKTPKKSPAFGSSSSAQSLRMFSPFGTPSRGTRDALLDPEDDWMRHFQSPSELFAAYTTLGASPSPSHSNR